MKYRGHSNKGMLATIAFVLVTAFALAGCGGQPMSTREEGTLGGGGCARWMRAAGDVDECGRDAGWWRAGRWRGRAGRCGSGTSGRRRGDRWRAWRGHRLCRGQFDAEPAERNSAAARADSEPAV